MISYGGVCLYNAVQWLGEGRAASAKCGQYSRLAGATVQRLRAAAHYTASPNDRLLGSNVAVLPRRCRQALRVVAQRLHIATHGTGEFGTIRSLQGQQS
jgi:hypothetical protein